MPKKSEQPPWVPMLEHLKQKEPEAGSMLFAIKDLEQELASGKRQSMRRDINTDICEPLSASFWEQHRIFVEPWGSVVIYRAAPDEPRRWDTFAAVQGRVDGHIYFVSADHGAPAARREGARLLSQDQVDRGKEQLKLKLKDPGENPRRWWLQKSAAKQIAKFLGLPERSAQTVEDEIVIPVFDELGLRKPKK